MADGSDGSSRLSYFVELLDASLRLVRDRERHGERQTEAKRKKDIQTFVVLLDTLCFESLRSVGRRWSQQQRAIRARCILRRQ